MNLRNATFTLLLACMLAIGAVPANADETDLAKTDPENTTLPEMPDAVASFGAAVLGDHLYVYGGHIGRSHQHSTDNLSHHFRRLDLRHPEGGWQDLGAVPGLQGLALVAVGDEVCRLGGMTARNGQDEDEDLYSVDEVQCFRPAEGTAISDQDGSWPDRSWHALPSLPAPRSSHDAVVLDGRIYVVGGWQLRGAELDPAWHHELWRLDPSAAEPAWERIEQPFQRRALAVAAVAGRLYALGGLNEDGTSRRVDIFDPATGTWSQGPDLPADEGLKGFGASAFGAGGQLYSSTADGNVHALDPSGAWRAGVHTLEHPRFFHRLLVDGDQLLFVGGAHRGGHRADIEVVPLASLAQDTLAVWPGFRGFGDSHARSADVPVSWSQNELAWHVELPGYGQSSPIVWGDKVFVTSVEGDFKETLVLTCLDLDSGEVSWQRRFPASQKIKLSDMVSRAAPTPVVDAQRVYAFWESGDVIAVDHQGDALWQRSLTDDYGPFQGNHGIASSPVLVGASVVVQATHEGPSYLIALDRQTGTTRWKVERPARVAWTTPAVAAGPDGPQLLSSANGHVEAIDATSGELRWRLDGVEGNTAPSATVDGNLVYVASSNADSNLALRRGPSQPGAPTSGDAASRIQWRGDGITSGFGSPLVHGDCVLFVNKTGVVSCADKESGELRWRHRLGEACWASPVAAGDSVYFFTRKGATTVLQHNGSIVTVVAENLLPTDDTVYGVAAVPGAFLIRTGRELVRVGPVEPSRPQKSGPQQSQAERQHMVDSTHVESTPGSYQRPHRGSDLPAALKAVHDRPRR